jgi:hypothetical protein
MSECLIMVSEQKGVDKEAQTKGRKTFSESKRLAYTGIKYLTRDLNQAMEP